MKNDNLSIDKNLLETLCSYHLELGVIAPIFKCEPQGIIDFVAKEYSLTWDNFYKQFSAKGKAKIRENQIKLSAKSVQMAQYLDKKYLTPEQNDAILVQAEPKNNQNITKFLEKNTDFNNLVIKQREFILNYLTNKNIGESALLAGYAQDSAYMQGSRLLKNDKIKTIIDAFTKYQSEQCDDEKSLMISKLDEIINGEDTKPNEKINAIKVKAGMLGLNAPSQSQLLGKDGLPVDPVGPTVINKTYLESK